MRIARCHTFTRGNRGAILRDMKRDELGCETVLAIATREGGQEFLRELARQGCLVVLLTLEELRDGSWPHEILHELHTMPGGMTIGQIINTVTYFSRTRNFARIFALNEEDMETAAALREHMRIPGMGLTTARYFRDRVAMRTKAAQHRVRTPAFISILNYEVLLDYMEKVPAPWLLNSRIRTTEREALHCDAPECVWAALEKLGDDQSNFMLEQLIPGDIFFVDAIFAEKKVKFAAVLPGEGLESGDKRISRTDENELKVQHAGLVLRLGLRRGVSRTKFLRSHASGKLYFLETSAFPGDREALMQKYEIDLWVEWARVEVAAMREDTYKLHAIAPL